MLRIYVIVLVLAGIAASLFGRLPHSSAPSSRSLITLPAAPDGQIHTEVGQSVSELDHSIELTRDENGYFYADVEINGAPVHALIDTGSTVIALSRNDAQMASVATSIGMNDVIGQGADGVVKGEEVTLERVSLGDKTIEKIPAVVLSSGNQSLLGQSFLSRFASVKIQGDKMVLR